MRHLTLYSNPKLSQWDDVVVEEFGVSELIKLNLADLPGNNMPTVEQT